MSLRRAILGTYSSSPRSDLVFSAARPFLVDGARDRPRVLVRRSVPFVQIDQTSPYVCELDGERAREPPERSLRGCNRVRFTYLLCAARHDPKPRRARKRSEISGEGGERCAAEVAREAGSGARAT